MRADIACCDSGVGNGLTTDGRGGWGCNAQTTTLCSFKTVPFGSLSCSVWARQSRRKWERQRLRCWWSRWNKSVSSKSGAGIVTWNTHFFWYADSTRGQCLWLHMEIVSRQTKNTCQQNFIVPASVVVQYSSLWRFSSSQSRAAFLSCGKSKYIEVGNCAKNTHRPRDTAR